MRARRRDAALHCIDEFEIGPFADAGRVIRRDIRRIERSDGRLEGRSPGRQIGGYVLQIRLRLMTRPAAAGIEENFAVLNVGRMSWQVCQRQRLRGAQSPVCGKS